MPILHIFSQGRGPAEQLGKVQGGKVRRGVLLQQLLQCCVYVVKTRDKICVECAVDDSLDKVAYEVDVLGRCV